LTDSLRQAFEKAETIIPPGSRVSVWTFSQNGALAVISSVGSVRNLPDVHHLLPEHGAHPVKLIAV
jgi:hypothetical protein